jgi:hypothetical protein
MPTALREHLYAVLMLATAVLLVVGVVIFWTAVTVQGFVAAGLVSIAGVACPTPKLPPS